MNSGQNHTDEKLMQQEPKANPELSIIIERFNHVINRYHEVNCQIAEKLDNIKGFEKHQKINNDSLPKRGSTALDLIQSMLDALELENDRAYANLEHLQSII
jgi:Rad3-related DNA helicase